MLLATGKLVKAEDDLDLLVKNFPSISANHAPTLTPATIIKFTWCRTDLVEMFSINQISIIDSQAKLNGNTLEFLTPELSKANYPDPTTRKIKQPMVIYQWQFDIENEGEYILFASKEAGTLGYINKDQVILLNNGIISKKNSGKQSIKLSKGINKLYLPTTPGASNQLIVVPDSNKALIIGEINKKLLSENKEDYFWIMNNFLLYLCSLQNGSHPYVTKILSQLNKLRPFEKEEKAISFLKPLISPNFNGYMIEKFIYMNFPETYFKTTAPSGSKEATLNGFLWENNLP